MKYLKFDKSQLVNLEYSLSREILRANRAGSYSCTTIIDCNTRKYHGLLVSPMEHLDGGNHVLLSSLDETIIFNDQYFNLGIHKYAGDHYEPKGHKYLDDFEMEPIPKSTYRVGTAVLTKETLLAEMEEQILIRYTLQDSDSGIITLRLKPFLAFRNVHALSKVNLDANSKFEYVNNGIKTRLYDAYPHLFMQLSKKTDFIPVPDWYYNIEYMEEQKRGYDYKEDLYVPGFFEYQLKQGESIIFSAGLNESKIFGLNTKFEDEIRKRIPMNNFENCLKNSAQQFFVKRNGKTEINAGFPWFGRWGRDTFISLPGLTLTMGDTVTCQQVLDTMGNELNGALFPNIGEGGSAALNSVDAPLWYFWAVQQYTDYTKNYLGVWEKYGKNLKTILNGYKAGTDFNIKMQKNGLIYAGDEGKALTWMDAIVNGKPVTPRAGYGVEINALWYNAVCFSLELAEKSGDKGFIKLWGSYPALIKKSFNNVFWDNEKGYLADYANNTIKDWSVRPNQVIAASMPYSPLGEDQIKSILDIIQKELLTPKGLRTLSPKSPGYKGRYEGNQESRDAAYHQGTVWPWLLGHFTEAYLKIYNTYGIGFAKHLYSGFEEEIKQHGIGSISEIYDGDPPHQPRGAISQAWSVAEVLRINFLIKKHL